MTRGRLVVGDGRVEDFLHPAGLDRIHFADEERAAVVLGRVPAVTSLAFNSVFSQPSEGISERTSLRDLKALAATDRLVGGGAKGDNPGAKDR